MPEARNLRGQVFGFLTAERWTDRRDRNGSIIWSCRCACGGAKDVSCRELLARRVCSCGCLSRRRSAAFMRTLAIQQHKMARFGAFAVLCANTFPTL